MNLFNHFQFENNFSSNRNVLSKQNVSCNIGFVYSCLNSVKNTKFILHLKMFIIIL